jgi:predicted glycoside hydrolase/deacetylase ChbG (UPF0249 family)
LRPGVTELMVHPGHVDDALYQTPTRLLSCRAEELALLRSPRISGALNEHNIRLIRHDLVPIQTPFTRSFRDAS